tara:strand:- start:788 stop:1051 length:264 start_codon:yes stop_codon:yes gene_type:complete
MRKLILSLVFVLATGMSFINATATNDEVLPTTKEAIEVVEEFGCASDCVDSAVHFVTWLADGQDLNSNEIFMWSYKIAYAECYNTKC